MTTKAYREGRQAGRTPGSVNPYPRWILETTNCFDHSEWNRGRNDEELEIEAAKQKYDYERQLEMKDEEVKKQPYLVSRLVMYQYFHNPAFGDDKLCTCGHPYYRHFDTYENMLPVGCKYCMCFDFKLAPPTSDEEELPLNDDF